MRDDTFTSIGSAGLPDALDSADDLQAGQVFVEKLWNDQGITTERYQSGGDEPILGIRGSGGPTTSIDFLADERGYSVDALSPCADGDPVELENHGE